MTTPAVFKQEWFAFEEDEQVLEHLDDFPPRDQRDPNLHHIEGFIPNDGDFVWLAINLPDETTAVRMLKAARRQIKARIEQAGGLRIDMVSNAAHVGPNNEGRWESMRGRADQQL